jgi:hypothetical protein
MGPRTAANVQSEHIWSQFDASVVLTAGALAGSEEPGCAVSAWIPTGISALINSRGRIW